jgi:hypothetical protein
MTSSDKIFLTTFSLFMIEGIMHYNYGRNGLDSNKPKSFIPPTKNLIEIALIVGAFSVINSVILEKN